MKSIFTIALLCTMMVGKAQDLTFNNIHKIVEAKKYREAIVKLHEFIKKEPKHISAHYDLANCYNRLLDEIIKIQNANMKNQNTTLWGEKEYQENLNFWKSGVGVIDSAIIYYKETSELMNIQFLTLDLRYDEFFQATKDCGAIMKVKCARAYLAKAINDLEGVNASNKSKMFNVEKEYEAFKAKGKYAGTYDLVQDDTHEAAGNIVIKYVNGNYYAESDIGSAHYTLKNFNISGDNISFYLGDEEYFKGTILSNPNGSIEISVESKSYSNKFIKK